MSRVYPVTVYGRVISPAEIRQTNNGQEFITFPVAVNNLLNKNESGVISCSYFPPKNRDVRTDIVACSLAWMGSKDQQGLQLANGNDYKSLEVIVQGSLAFNSTKEGKGVYVNLQYVTVDILNWDVINAVKSALGMDSGNANNYSQPQASAQVAAPQAPAHQQATVAPSMPGRNVGNLAAAQQAPAPVGAPMQSTANLQEGAFFEAGGNIYQIKEGKQVFVSQAPAAGAAPAQQATAPQQQAPSQPASLHDVISQGNTPPTV